MKKRFQQKRSIRLFNNPLLESLSHVHPVVPLLLWSPLVVFLLYRSLWTHQLALLPVLAVGLAALLVWTLTEYLVHRFLFHFPAQNRFSRWLVFMCHGVHHDAPQEKTRLLMPPVPAMILMALLWGGFSLLIPSPWLDPFIAFFIVGYLIYDYTHYATHHWRMKSRLGRFIKRYHMQHHFSKPDAYYGVTSPLWDIIGGTRGK